MAAGADGFGGGDCNFTFLSGNSVSGRVTLSPSSDGRPNRIMRRAGGFRDEPKLMGSTSYGVGFADWTCDQPDHWIFQGTGMKKGDAVAFCVNERPVEGVRGTYRARMRHGVATVRAGRRMVLGVIFHDAP